MHVICSRFWCRPPLSAAVSLTWLQGMYLIVICFVYFDMQMLHQSASGAGAPHQLHSLKKIRRMWPHSALPKGAGRHNARYQQLQMGRQLKTCEAHLDVL